MTVAMAVQPARAVTTSDDPNAPHHLLQPDSPYNMVGSINRAGGTTGVLIGPRHVLTAKHVVSGAPDPTLITFTLELPDGTHVFHVGERIMHGDEDIAMLILTEHTGLAGYALYSSYDEAGHTGTVVGFGMGGTGLTGGVLPAGTGRIAHNRIDQAYQTTIGFDFDQWDGNNDGPWDGDSLGETLEGLVTTGDSGGGLFVESGGRPLLAGIHSKVGPAGGEDPLGMYGDYATDVRISALRSWIAAQVPGDATGDGRIDGADYTVWADHYGDTPVPPWSAGGASVGNFNNDAIVDGADYTVWADNYLFGTGGDVAFPLAGAPLPEPATLLLLTLGAAPLLRRPR